MKNLVVDTNVLLTNPNFLKKQPDCIIIIPVAVIKELDKFKGDPFQKGMNAREASRILEKYRTLPEEECPVKFISKKEYDSTLPTDDVLIEVAKKYDARVVSNDLNVRITAACEGVDAEEYKDSYRYKVKPLKECKGFTTLRKNPFSKKTKLSNKNPNHYYLYKEKGEKKFKVYKKTKKDQVELVSHKSYKNVEGISAKSHFQQMAMDALMDPSIQLVTLIGSAGTGKTLLSLACGIHQCRFKSNDDFVPRYNSVSVGRAIIPLGKDMGALPGEIEDKLRPFLSPIYDNLDVLAEHKGDKFNQNYTAKLMDSEDKLVEIQALAFLRGRSLCKKFLIIDEAQNLSIHEAKTILTRAGEGTKIVLLGDPNQIDNSQLDMYNNGLTFVTEKFMGQKCFSTVTLEKVERSSLAELAVKVLEI